MKKKTQLIIWIILAVLALALCTFLCVNIIIAKTHEVKNPVATFEIENYGTVKIELYPEYAPNTVTNFINLVEDKFYDGLTFHRIMDGFMIQGGDPNANGTGGNVHTIKGEFSSNDIENNISHVRGVVSMARNGADNNSASSQFFIVHQDSTFLDGQYASFGHVTKGIEVVDAIASVRTSPNDRPLEAVVIKDIRIEK